jgi:uncharacterized membrane protein
MAENLKYNPNIMIRYWPLIFGMTIILITLGFYVANFYGYSISEDINDWGAFGDYFGGLLNPTFSLITLILLVLTIRLQLKELEYTRKELEYTRKELKKSADARKEQNKNQERQNFEGTFFQLLQLYHNQVNTLTLLTENMENGRELKGRECFLSFYKVLQDIYKNTVAEKTVRSDIKIIEHSYKKLYSYGYQESLGHYFRNIYNIIFFVSEHENIDDKDKHKYINILRAQLSSYELCFIFYNCLYSKYVVKEVGFFNLVEKYYLFECLLKTLLLPNTVAGKKRHYNMFPENAKNDPYVDYDLFEKSNFQTSSTAVETRELILD